MNHPAKIQVYEPPAPRKGPRTFNSIMRHILSRFIEAKAKILEGQEEARACQKDFKSLGVGRHEEVLIYKVKKTTVKKHTRRAHRVVRVITKR